MGLTLLHEIAHIAATIGDDDDADSLCLEALADNHSDDDSGCAACNEAAMAALELDALCKQICESPGEPTPTLALLLAQAKQKLAKQMEFCAMSNQSGACEICISFSAYGGDASDPKCACEIG